MLNLLGMISGDPAAPAQTAQPNGLRADAGQQENLTGGPPGNGSAGAGTILERRRKSGGVALALGGGVAKGWAHIGLLRAFEQEKVPVAMIAGTSIGALVGGCYLAGKLNELEEFARSLTRTNIFRYMDFTIAGAGIISGSRLAATMEKHMGGMTIEQLPANFISVCTDITTGHEIWLHDGPLIESLRASYALPGVFAPITHGGRQLVDGALVNPVPVSACRLYEPDIVIAVDLNSETFGRGTVIRASHYEPVPSDSETAVARSASWLDFFSQTDHRGIHGAVDAPAPERTLTQPKVQPKSHLGTMGVMMEAFNIIQDRITRARMAGDPPDFTIRPRLAAIGLAEFHKADEAIRIGYQEGLKRIRELADQGQLERA